MPPTSRSGPPAVDRRPAAVMAFGALTVEPGPQLFVFDDE
jgi:hypothetical protein